MYSCAIYATAIGLDLRAGYGPDDVLKAQGFVDGTNVESADRRARAVAQQWLKQLIATPDSSATNLGTAGLSCV